MKLLPYASFEIETAVPIGDVVAKLRNQVAPNSFLPRPRTQHRFEGNVSESGFVIRPVAGAHSSFLPVIHGRLIRNRDSIVVSVQSVPSTTVLTFITAVFGLLCMLIFYEGPTVFATAAASAVVAWFLSVCGFWLDGGRSRRELEKIIQSNSTPHQHH